MAKRWTDNEMTYVRKNWGELTAPEIAADLERTVDAVQWMANKLGLANPYKKQHCNYAKPDDDGPDYDNGNENANWCALGLCIIAGHSRHKALKEVGL